MTPQSPLQVYTVRIAILDTALWSDASLVNLYKTPLKALGFQTSQLPAILYPPAQVKVTANDPFDGARTIVVNNSDLGTFQQTRDTRVPLSEDPATLADAGKAFFTSITWNLCHSSQEDKAGDLRNLFRTVKPAIGAIKTSPIVTVFSAAPELLPGYPQKQPRPVSGTVPVTGAAGPKKEIPTWLKVGMGIVGLWSAHKAKIF